MSPRATSLNAAADQDAGSLNQTPLKGLQAPTPDTIPMVTVAWDNLRRSLVYFHGKPMGTIAALDSREVALNYIQVFVRDPSALAFL